MLNFVCATDQDRREAAAIDRRRALEEERKKRIFNPKARISLDYEALDEQIAQKRKLQEEERQRDSRFQQQEDQFQLIAKAMQEKEKAERRKLAQEINNFRMNFQRLEDRREYDLNDPNTYKAIPARLYDDDPRCGPSSLQRFEGEDMYNKERSAIQKDQLRSWLDQQIDEKEAAEKERIDAENAFKAALMARDHRAVELENIEKQCRKRLETACSQYNKALADERELRRREREKQELQDTLAHKYNVMMSDMMTENLDSSSALGPTRKTASQFKGMSPQQRSEFIAAQREQIEQAKARKIEEKKFDKEWDEYFEGLQKSIASMDQELARKQKEINKNIQEENIRLGKEQKSQQEFLNNIVYSNRPTAAYYDQFNNSAR